MRRFFTKSMPVFLFALFILTGNAFAEKRFFELTIDTVKIKVNPDLEYTVFAFNGQVPAPLIHVKEDDIVTVKVTNLTELPHTIHWHGIYNTWKNDGVPNVTQTNIDPGKSFTYTWKAKPSGSMWYHCHVNVNEHVAYRGMWGPIVVDPKKPTKLEKQITKGKDLIMMLSAYDAQWKDKPGFGGLPTDTANYFSINGRSFPLTMPFRVKKGDKVRIRLYGAGGEIHAMHTHGHHFLVTHKDGFPLPAPYWSDTILIGPGERYDIMLTMNNPGRYIMHDHVDIHVTNNGKYPGGAITVMEYEGIQRDDDWYAYKGIDYNGDFFFQESLTKGYGMFEQEKFKGKRPKRKRRRN